MYVHILYTRSIPVENLNPRPEQYMYIYIYIDSEQGILQLCTGLSTKDATPTTNIEFLSSLVLIKYVHHACNHTLR